MALPTTEQAVKDFISHQGGQFTEKQANALRQVFQKFIDEVESLDERLAIVEAGP